MAVQVQTQLVMDAVVVEAAVAVVELLPMAVALAVEQETADS
jgi:hypothetical protein